MSSSPAGPWVRWPLSRLAAALPGPASVAELAAVDPSYCGQADLVELIAALERAAGWLAALTAAAVTALDARTGDAGLCTDWTAEQIALSTHTGVGNAHHLLHTARALTELPAAAAALREGRITAAHLRAITSVIDNGQMSVQDQQAIDAALPLRPGPGPDGRPLAGRPSDYDQDRRTALTPAALRRAALRAATERRPDLYADKAAAAHRDRGLWFWPVDDTAEGSFEARLPVDDYEQVHTLIDQHAQRRGPGDPRRVAARRLDALLDLLLRPHQLNPDQGRPDGTGHGQTPPGPSPSVRPAISLHVLAPARTLTGQDEPGLLLPGGHPLAPHTVRRLACRAASTDVLVYDQRTDDLLTLGPSRRIPTRRLRRYLALRDQYCRWPGCQRSPQRCDAHHVIFHSAHGPTTPENLIMLCPQHHLAVHEGGWTLAGDAAHTLTLTSPTGHSYTSTPPPFRLRVPAQPEPRSAVRGRGPDCPAGRPDVALYPDPYPEPSWIDHPGTPPPDVGWCESVPWPSAPPDPDPHPDPDPD